MNLKGLRAKTRYLSVFILPAVFLVLSAPAAALAAGGSVEVKGLRHWSSAGHTRVVVDLSGPAEFTKNRLRNPRRLFIDLKGSRIAGKKTIPVGKGILKKIRAAQYDSNTVRVVLEVGKLKDFKVFLLSDPSRVVIDIFGKEGNKGRSKKRSIRKVVIDPGHGGRDPGAVGPGRIKEKDIVLDVALRLRKILKKAGYEVILTRDKDVFLSLKQRMVIANREDADLFVSIHVNANSHKSVRGVETYLLNWTDDEEAMRVAARENAISFKKMKASRSELGIILASLELQNKRDESLELAYYVQKCTVNTLSKRYRHINNLGVKQALFHVLLGAKMPSVLVEVSFVTNREEARRLKTKTYRQYLARGVATGIKTYFTRHYQPAKLALK